MQKKLNPTRGFTQHTFHKGLRPQAPDSFGLNSLRQLVIRYHWLAFLSQVCKESKTSSSNLGPQFNKNFEYKIDHISKKLKIEKI